MIEPLRITSRDNQHLKFARRVRDRKEPGFMFVEGKLLCREALASQLVIEQLFISDKLTTEEVDSYVNDSVQTFTVADKLIGSISDTESPQGVFLVARRPKSKSIDELFEVPLPNRMPLWLGLERPNNPSNLGAAIRTADAAGLRGVFVTSGSADPFAPKSLRASMGSAFRLPIVSEADLAMLFATAKRKGVTIAAMDAEGEQNYLDFDWTKPTLLVVGSEADGIGSVAATDADHTIRIEMEQPVESLNLAVSAGVVLFEAVRQSRLSNR